MNKLCCIILFLMAAAGPLTAHRAIHKPAKKNLAARHKPVEVTPGADQTGLYINYLKHKNIGMVVNQTSVIGKYHISSIDSLMKRGIRVKKIFGPEHGFRGNASNGASISDSIDPQTGIPAISLYGKHFKPSTEDLKGIDLMVFDIQDVGARFYTYISTLHYVMEACAENNIELLILDRPNPNAFYVDGPVLDTAYRSFVGMHTVPVVYGMTIAEYAQMINGEGWLKDHVKCRLKIIKVANYTHATPYVLPISPSPNLNTNQSVLLYPSLCLFEGTTISLGRGTMFPFQVLGHPAFKGLYSFQFIPVSIKGMSEDPPHKNEICFGIDLRNFDTDSIRIKGKIDILWLIKLYRDFPDKEHFFNNYFTKLAGNQQLKKQIETGKTVNEIRQSWEPALSKFKIIRKRYLLYK